ncbi:hypothetical protein BCV71DRAFT_284317 [Rhizopus microsporus]|uniref:Coth-domain-containing protein n=1 Tax=Rhizopus microsporus TaxID=58291 RepID=A0A1X0S4F7_RHIZD|nr:hypothetical protein BCV71DRAFT_284317 [Rhizopus microsporus]
MAVVVDNTTYALEPNVTFPIIYSAKAPSAQSGYLYAKIYSSNDSMLTESFLPQVYGPLDDIHRIESKLHRDNEMPTIHIVGNQPELDEMNHSITADISVKTDIAYASLYNALNFEDVKISLAGQSTRGLSKVSYNLKSKQKSPLYGYRHVKLGSLAMDSSYMREQLAYDMLKSVGLTSIGFSYAHVFMNERELGLFGLFDTFKSSWLANVFANGSSSYENGYLYQGVFQGSKQYEADLFYIDNITAYSDGEYKVKQKASNGESDNYEPLMEFTKFIANASSEWNSKLVIDSFLRPAVMESLIGNSDGNGKNDLDDTWNGNYSTFPGMSKRSLITHIMAVLEFKQRFEQLHKDINSRLINPNVSYSCVDNIVDMIKEDIDWDKALSRVNSNSASSAPLGQNGNGNNQTIPSITVQGNSTGIPQGMQNMTAMAENRGNMGISVSMKEWLASVYQNTTNFYSK